MVLTRNCPNCFGPPCRGAPKSAHPTRPATLGRVLAVLLGFQFVASASAAASVLTNSIASPVAGLPPVGFSLVRLVGALALVFAIFLGGIWLSRNWRRVVRSKGRSPELRIVEMKSMGGRQALWIVAHRRQRLLVGSSPAGLTLLTELPDAETNEPEPAPAMDFAEALRMILPPKR